MGKDCVPKVDGYWLVKEKTFEKCGAFATDHLDHHDTRQDPCCVRKDCYAFCVEQCYRFVVAFYIPKKHDDPLEKLMYQPLIGVFDKEYNECGDFRQWVLHVVGSRDNSSYKFYPVSYKKKCVKCMKFSSFKPLGNFEWFYPQREGVYDPASTAGPIGPQKSCSKCEDKFLPQAVSHGTAKRIKQRKVCKALRKCECLDLGAFRTALMEIPPCDYC